MTDRSISELIIARCKRGITPETAWLLAQAFGTTLQFWLDLQMQYELELNKPGRKIDPLFAPTA